MDRQQKANNWITVVLCVGARACVCVCVCPCTYDDRRGADRRSLKKLYVGALSNAKEGVGSCGMLCCTGTVAAITKACEIYGSERVNVCHLRQVLPKRHLENCTLRTKKMGRRTYQ